MANVTLNLTKPGDVAKKITLNLKKLEWFLIKLLWDESPDPSAPTTDLDLHSFRCVNRGNGAKIEGPEDILSTYAVRRIVEGGEVGWLVPAADGTFQIYDGAMVHSKDAPNGAADGVDESMRVDPSKVPVPNGTFVELPIIGMIHPQSSGKQFRDVQNATLVIENSNGVEVLRVRLSEQFGDFIGVHAGSILISDAGVVEFSNETAGFNEDFNQVIGQFQ
jgi:hypothetical protein